MSDSLEKIKPFLTVNILGAERSFRYNLWSCVQFQRLRKKSLLASPPDFTDIEELAVLLWAGLIPENKELDGKIDALGNPEQKILDTIDLILSSSELSDYRPYVDLVAEAMKLASPKESDAPKKKEKEKA